MGLIKNDLTYGYGFNITASGPVDSRLRVETKEDLTTVFDANAPAYQGMIVSVMATGEVYVLKGADATNEANWIKLDSGSASSGVVTALTGRVDSLEKSLNDEHAIGGDDYEPTNA